MPATYRFKWIAFFTTIITVGESLAVYHGYSWSEVKLNQSKVPTPRVHASTWVDNNELLWLYDDESISNTTSNFKLWKFDRKKLKWYPVIHAIANISDVPPNHLTCFCAGLVFIMQGYSVKSVLHEKIWMYNSSRNSWYVRNLPSWEMKDGAKQHLALWCNHDIVSLLTNPNNTILYLWYYNTTSDKWNHMALNGTEFVPNMLSKTTSGTNYVVWNNAKGTKYLYFWTAGLFNNSVLLSIHNSKAEFYHILGPQPGCREKFVHWSDSSGNLWVAGGKICNSSQLCSDQWVLDISMLKWVPVSFQIPTPFPRAGSLTWEVGNAIWLYGGSARQYNGSVVVWHDLWVSKPIKHLVPLRPSHHLPGDSLGLSLTDKLIISGLVLLAVMTISVRLCYKRELNQILSKLRRRRVPYHQLSQEGDKSSRL